MWPELWTRRFVISPVTQISPNCLSNSRRICSVNSVTEKTLRDCSTGKSSPKSHCLFTDFATPSHYTKLPYSRNRIAKSTKFVSGLDSPRFTLSDFGVATMTDRGFYYLHVLSTLDQRHPALDSGFFARTRRPE